MEHVLTLIAAKAKLVPQTVAAIRAALEALGADTAPPDWLSPARACDVPFALLAPEQAEAAARKVLGRKAIDVAAQPAEGRRKRLLVADMDSTVVTTETLDQLAGHAGFGDAVAAITRRSIRGEVPFASSLRERVALLRGLPAAAVAATAAETELTPGARTLVATMRAAGAHTVLISGGMREIVAAVAESCGFDSHHGNTLAVEDGRLAGLVVEPVLDGEAKMRVLIGAASERRIPLDCALAVGDGANDLPMLAAAGLGVAFRASPTVAAEARVRVEHGDLTALLYLQGYRDAEFVG